MAQEAGGLHMNLLNGSLMKARSLWQEMVVSWQFPVSKLA